MASALSLAAMVHGLCDDGLFDVWQSRSLEVARRTELEDAPWLSAPYTFARARVAVQQGALEQASAVVQRALEEFGEGWWAPYARASAAELAVVAGLPNAPDVLAAVAPDAAENDWAAACLTRATARSTGDADALLAAAEAFDRIDARFERACTLALHPARAAEGRAELEALRVPAR